ncbi:MAG TPA: hypothetical protein VIC56_04510 [Gemmatimonadota bacterium]
MYDTPWRAHVVFPAAAWGLAAAVCLLALRRRPRSRAASAALGVFTAGTLLFPIGFLGLFEGGYNHVLKDALWLGGASPAVTTRLFPPPTYETPDDVFFEVTGVLHLPLAIVLLRDLVRLLAARRRGTERPGPGAP